MQLSDQERLIEEDKDAMKLKEERLQALSFEKRQFLNRIESLEEELGEVMDKY